MHKDAHILRTESVFVPTPALPEDARARIRARSRALFGNLDRLEVMAAIAASVDGVVNATDLQWQLQIANNRVRAQLVALTELGLLQQVPTEARKRYYVRIDSPFWPTCLDLYAQWSR
jgi:hypothetical protein